MRNPFDEVYERANSSSEKIDFPRLIDIELTNACGFRCSFCPNGNGKMKREKGMMSTETFEKILEQTKGVPLRFSRWGEPALHPRLYDWIGRAKQNGSIVHLNTNGFWLDVHRFRDVPLDSIKFSFQGYNAKTYKKARGVDFFNRLIQKVKTLHYQENKPFTHVSTTVEKGEEGRADTFCDQMRKYANRVTWGITKHDGDKRPVRQHCPEVFSKLSIDWDGKVTACCLDYDNFMVVGDVKDLKEAWNSLKMDTYREMLGQGRMRELELCSSCINYYAQPLL